VGQGSRTKSASAVARQDGFGGAELVDPGCAGCGSVEAGLDTVTCIC
jgi:hypothetical protein